MLKKQNKIGILLFICSSLIAAAGVYFSFSGEGFIANLNNVDPKSSYTMAIVCLFALFYGVKIKKIYPDYYKYQIISSVILLMTVLVTDIIPRLYLGI